MGHEYDFPSRTRRRTLISAALVLADGLTLTMAAWVATFARFGQLAHVEAIGTLGPNVTFVDLSFVVTLIGMVVFASEGLYDPTRVFWGTGEYKRVARGLSIAVVFFIMATFTLKLPGLSRGWTVLVWAFGILFVVLGRAAVRMLVIHTRRRGRLLRPTLIVGMNEEGEAIARSLRKNVSSGLVPVGFLANSAVAECVDLGDDRPAIPCLGYAGELKRVLDEHVFDTVLIASTAFKLEVLARIIAELRDRDVDIQLSSGLLDVTTSRVQIREVSGVPLITLRGVSFAPWKRFVKRSFDLTVGGVIVLLGLPVWLALAAAIKLDSRGPVFYRQPRVGRDGRVFFMYKFRSMCADAEQRLAGLRDSNEATGPLFKMREDPRVTRVGRIIRRYSLDEFPQLINVLRGEMSLVGPRPPLPTETELYSDHHWRRMEVLPGMTGLWQVSGRSALTFDEMIRLDLFYIENWSVGMDLALLARTIPAVILPEGAY